MKKPIIEFKQFTFQYFTQAEPTLQDIDVTIYEGEKVLVIGPSGSGKSTFAHCINGLIPNQYEGEAKGELWINNRQVFQDSLFDRSFETSTVLQDTDGQFIGLTVAEDIAFALENDEKPVTYMKEQVQKWAEIVDVDHYLAHRPQDLSGGQKQRVSMAGVLINEAPILVFDEPLANLDPQAGQEAIALIDQIHKENKTTILIIEHRLEEVLTHEVDRILLFHEGAIVANVTPNELLASATLSAYGIREPLYISALKYAGVDLTTLDQLTPLSKVSHPLIHEKLTQWQKQLDEKIQSQDTKPLLTLREFSAGYLKNQPTVKQISLTVNRKERISIVGKNGAGKSTLIKAICGFLPIQGEIMLNGCSIKQASIKERADHIGYVMQNPNQMISQKMIVDEIALGLVLRGVEENVIKEKVDRVLKICGLYAFRNWPISALSYGQKKRVTIASILVLEPEIILLDEPTAGQDFYHYTEMMQFIDQLSEQGNTIIMVTHDMHLMLEYTDRVLVIDQGQLLADTTPVDVLTDKLLIKQASLAETSLFTLAKQFELNDPIAFTHQFITHDRKVRKQ
ncbi:ABC transporter ATP-binding protein [uncultured Enterococcus sp.]|uniref:ABC transporter ATP-binding protein n=1 Tax=uncultured Enterococcus sp. TaxID=167972 RepID=UPI0025FFC8BF|nr:ABC transporter ATP-binding protein [uncultured Enterococcus sp.]